MRRLPGYFGCKLDGRVRIHECRAPFQWCFTMVSARICSLIITVVVGENIISKSNAQADLHGMRAWPAGDAGREHAGRVAARQHPGIPVAIP